MMLGPLSIAPLAVALSIAGLGWDISQSKVVSNSSPAVTPVRSQTPQSQPAQLPSQSNTSITADLEKVLDRMDVTAQNFRSAEANFEWDQYLAVVSETDKQSGKIYFRRVAGQTEMAADIATSNGKPLVKYVVFADGNVDVYQPSVSNNIDRYSTGKNREAVESFLVLGFGGSGHGMQKSFDVTYVGPDPKVGGAVQLNLVPKAEKVQQMFDHIILWIDLDRGVSVQQQLFTREGDYRLAKYSDIDLKAKIPDSAFRLKTNGKTQLVSH